MLVALAPSPVSGQKCGVCLSGDMKLGEVYSDDACGVSLGVSEAACALQLCSPGSALCSLELWFWISSKEPN